MNRADKITPWIRTVGDIGTLLLPPSYPGVLARGHKRGLRDLGMTYRAATIVAIGGCSYKGLHTAATTIAI